jgi:tRNA pseudouridine38-40 synthase
MSSSEKDLKQSADIADGRSDGEASEARAPYRQCAPGYTRLRMHISYDGTDFVGWQRQNTNKTNTVQGSIEEAVSKIAGEFVRVLGASRTDAGVHARGQVAHFDFPKNAEGWDFRYALQGMTPDSLVIKDLFLAPRDFHAIASVSDKIYKYQILNRQIPSALRRRYIHWVRFPLDVDHLNASAQYLVGKQDFKALQTSGTIVKTTVRTITEASWQRLDRDTLEFTVRGDGFLKQMVRNAVGTMVDLNMNERPPEKMREILETLDRRKAGPSAPAHGLFLERVNYPESIDNECRRL